MPKRTEHALDYVSPFEKINKTNVGIAGGKGASLGEMTQAGLPVPPGFIVITDAFEAFVLQDKTDQKIDEILKTVDIKKTETVEAASKKIRKMLSDLPIPKDVEGAIVRDSERLDAQYVAVRSSATAEDSKVASWAGELETYLFIPKEKLLDTVKTCWSSLFTPRAIFYRFEQKLNEMRVSVAVVVQKMVNSDVAGVVFTVHPVTKDKNQMVIEAGWGLGEYIVGGKITPDNYMLDKKDEVILDMNIASQEIKLVRKVGGGTKEESVPEKDQEKQKLANASIVKLAKMSKKIEEHYGSPQDIEWAMEDNKLYIVQSRPITTL